MFAWGALGFALGYALRLLNMATKLRVGDAVTKEDISLLCGLHDVCELESERLDKVLETA